MRKWKRVMLILLAVSIMWQSYSYADQIHPSEKTKGKKEEFIKKINADGSIPNHWNLPKPAIKRHPDRPPFGAGSSGDGRNDLDFTYFETGDFIVALGTPTGHAGEWDAQRSSGNLTDYCVWSANTQPVDGVQLEQPQKYRDYDEAYGLWVPSAQTSTRIAARDYCSYQNGEPYDITSQKWNQDEWYCSKLVWSSYYYPTNYSIDLDYDSGLYVWPLDLLYDDESAVFAYSN